MIDRQRQRPDPSPKEQHMDAEAIHNLRAFIAILQEWDRTSCGEPKTTRGHRLIESGFTSAKESGMS
ncbi:hypothetical protein KAR02_01125 [Candidatus Bipolaricaulota bacterium]|nr:hypothetical protein [Candidatus Bipolaricaulota bacterium]